MIPLTAPPPKRVPRNTRNITEARELSPEELAIYESGYQRGRSFGHWEERTCDFPLWLAVLIDAAIAFGIGYWLG